MHEKGPKVASKAVFLRGSSCGAVLGYFYAGLQVQEKILEATIRYGWVCGVGLDIPYYLWTGLGALLGACVTRPVLRLFQEQP